jgi:hypothetical protein
MAEPSPETGNANASVNWEQQAREWEERFKGLQRTLNTKEASWLSTQSAKEDAIAKLTAELHDQQTVRSGLDAQLKELTGRVQTMTTERETLSKDAATSKASLDRMKAIAQFPDLFEAESKGLLRTDLLGEDFVKFLGEFQAHQQGQAGQARSNLMRGAVPPVGATRTAPSATRDALMTQLSEAMRKGDNAAYDAVYAQLLGLDQK